MIHLKLFTIKNKKTNVILFNTIILGTALLYFTACKKNKKTEPECLPVAEVSYPNYAQLKVGNYWIYQHYTVDSLGNGVATNVFDSCYVQKDTLINGNKYYKQFRPDYVGPNWIYTRDSLHYIITTSSQIIFSSSDMNRVFNSDYATHENNGVLDTIYFSTAKMTDIDYIKNTPAGDFKTINFKLNFRMFEGWNQNGLNRPLNTRYAKNVGIVSETLPFYNSVPNYTERRLVRYKIN
jgi:hypothetical protein